MAICRKSETLSRARIADKQIEFSALRFAHSQDKRDTQYRRHRKACNLKRVEHK